MTLQIQRTFRDLEECKKDRKKFKAAMAIKGQLTFGLSQEPFAVY